MPFENLPGIFNTKLDGNLTVPNTNDSPIVTVIGTSGQGISDQQFTAIRVSDAAGEFGKEGTLIRGMYEANSTGASNLRLLRMGAKAARVANLADGVLTIETIAKDGSAGDLHKVHYLSATPRLRVYRAADDLLVFDTGVPGDLSTRLDLGEVVVTLTGALGQGDDLGIVSGLPEDSAVLMSEIPDAATPNGSLSAVFTAGDDGLLMNRMQHYEALQDAYRLLEDSELDFVLPKNVYLDDKNIADMAPATASGLMSAVTEHADITPESLTDVLGFFRQEEYEGRWYYWWDVDFDGVAEITPTVDGVSGGAQTLIDAGTHSIQAAIAAGSADLEAGSFYEVNFAYQLANFCFRTSHLNTECTGAIGVRPPNSFAPKDVSVWVGQEPRTQINAQGETVIIANGKGLLGNKFMAGRITEGGVPAYRNGAVNGGFIGTDNGTLAGVELVDANEALVDIGKYIDVVSAYPLMSNPSRAGQYASTGAASYAGLSTRLRPASAATNKVVPNVRLPFRIAQSKVDLLAGKRYVHFHQKPKGVVVSDAPTAARPSSDYTRRSTMNIVKACIDTVRSVGEPFLGEGMSASQLAALETAIAGALGDLAQAGILNRFELSVTSTSLQRIEGKADVTLVLVPAFELRQINVTVALAAA